MPEEFFNQRITVMGLGRFGGGSGVTRWLAMHGARVLLTDMQPQEKLRQPLGEIADLIDSGAVALRLGEHLDADFAACDLVIANPAVPKPWENRYLLAAQSASVPIATEIRLLVERINRHRVIGVTGSAGKSTTTAMIHHILVKAGIRSHLGGNIGGSLLNHLDQIKPDDWIVLELSSAMLHWLGDGVGFSNAKAWSPHVAVLTNITPNHLDWHGSFDHYRDSKLNIVRGQSAADKTLKGDDVRISASPIELQIPGRHNQHNAQLAMRAVESAIGLPSDTTASHLADFPGLPHRLQLAAQRGGLRFYNDSKSTTPEATLLAVAAFDDPSRIHLIAGGYDKGSDLQPISSLAPTLAGLYTIGATGSGLASAAPRGAFASYCKSLSTAVERAMTRMNDRDVLLLSPGCASWDQFDNYEQRGEEFLRLVGSALAAIPQRTWSGFN